MSRKVENVYVIIFVVFLGKSEMIEFLNEIGNPFELQVLRNKIYNERAKMQKNENIHLNDLGLE